ncbi:MAG: hypothetical protein ABW200_05690, partial [Hyphomicrobiaceae bacterium]
ARELKQTEPAIDFPQAVYSLCAQFRDEAYHPDHFRPWLSRGSHRAGESSSPRSALAISIYADRRSR